MEIQNEIIKTRKRIGLLEQQNNAFKILLDEALSVTEKTSIKSEEEFLQEAIQVIQKESENLREDLSTIGDNDASDFNKKLENLENLIKNQQSLIENLQREQTEIKFLLLHPKSNNPEWLKNILELETDITATKDPSLVEERFRLQRKILNLEKKKDELLQAINSTAIIPAEARDFNQSEPFNEYSELRYKMLNLEDERSRLLSDLQCVLDRSRHEIAYEYQKLQEKIVTVGRGKVDLSVQSELLINDDVFEAGDEAIQMISELPRSLAGPRLNFLPVFCSIL